MPPGLAALVLSLALLARGQSGQPNEDADTLTASDSRGNISTVYNRFDGQNHSIELRRLTTQGYVVWSYQHYDSYYEKAYSAAMDYSGNLFIAGVRDAQGQKNFLLIKYADNGSLAWENADTDSNCTATSVAVDRDNNVVVAGVCRYSASYPVKVVKYNNWGSLLWSNNYDGGGRNYMRGMQLDYQGNISLNVESIYGNFRDGSYATKTVVYSPSGQQLEVR